MAKFNIASYMAYLKMSHNDHFLVEGKFDKLSIQYLLNNNSLMYSRNLDIEVAEDFIEFDDIQGNREKVRIICSYAMKNKNPGKFLGLIDREFDDFLMDQNCLMNNYEDRFYSQNLLSTHGHSIENYFFENDILLYAFRALTTNPVAIKSLNKFKKVYQSAIYLAGAITISSFKNIQYLSRIIASLEYSHFLLRADEVIFEKHLFKKALIKKGITTMDAQKIIDYISESLAYVKNSDLDSIRWFCHGHLSIRIMRFIYARCIHDSCDQDNFRIMQRDFLRTREEVFCTTLANYWASKAKEDIYIYPREIFLYFNISLN